MTERKPFTHLSLVADYFNSMRTLLLTQGVEGDEINEKTQKRKQAAIDRLTMIPDNALSGGYDFNKIVKQGERRITLWQQRRTNQE